MAKQTATKTPVSEETKGACFACAVAEGDIVNFRFLLLPYSPLREDSTEDIHTPKYAYLLPADREEPRFRDALALYSQPEIRAHIQAQLDKKGPAQLPAALLLRLADNAVRLDKFTSAGQAYELLRIRRRMQEEFFEQTAQALAAKDIPQAVRALRIATGLAYDYAAFPEPLPAVPKYPVQALMLHAEYPRRPEDCIALQPEETHLRHALAYLLNDAEAAARLDEQSIDVRRAFIVELIRQIDPGWEEFANRYRKACVMTEEFRQRLEERQAAAEAGGLAQEIAAQQEAEDPRRIPACLLGRVIEEGEWWQYLKELAYRHPASILFVSRQAVTKDLEIILPRHAADAPLLQPLGLEAK